MNEFRDRVLELRRVKASELIPNARNWRTHPPLQRAALRSVLRDIGYADALIARDTPDGLVLIDGHLRAEETPDAIVPVLVLDVTEDEADKLLLTLDPLASMAGRDQAMLDELLARVPTTEALAALLGELAGNTGGVTYTERIEAPVYEPRDVAPAVDELYDDTREQALVEEINAAELDEELREFLLAAAARHTVFHFDRIADFYAAASPEVQRLMERSALVIIDSAQAIELGFLRMHSEVLDVFTGDYPDA